MHNVWGWLLLNTKLLLWHILKYWVLRHGLRLLSILNRIRIYDCYHLWLIYILLWCIHHIPILLVLLHIWLLIWWSIHHLGLILRLCLLVHKWLLLLMLKRHLLYLRSFIGKLMSIIIFIISTY